MKYGIIIAGVAIQKAAQEWVNKQQETQAA